MQTFTIHIAVTDRLDFYSSELGIKKSHLIVASITIIHK